MEEPPKKTVLEWLQLVEDENPPTKNVLAWLQWVKDENPPTKPWERLQLAANAKEEDPPVEMDWLQLVSQVK